mmetsp:Transcript_13282/g.15230  ORF Transcript_13282/g.15230 Transcript_13282/m.15230 type:complete len:438 (+) Transcript_13282:54-1367(+)
MLSSPVFKKLPTKTYGVLVQRPYLNRVRDKLLGMNVSWTQLSSDQTQEPTSPCKDDCLSSSRLIIVDPPLKGGRKNRRGYIILIVRDAVLSSLNDLPPIARQNISSGMELTYTLSILQHEMNPDFVGSNLWLLLREKGFNFLSDVLRVDCYPRDKTDDICLSLQRATERVGTISMSKSTSKCTYNLYLVLDDEVSCYWIGLEVCGDHTKFNDHASRQVLISSTDSRTGVGSNEDETISSCIPVSRAFYKLCQVWEEELSQVLSDCLSASALDIGSAPGGWTQILAQHFSTVISVDPGILSRRVADMRGVKHIRGDMCSEAVITEISQTTKLLSLLVCDASTNSHETFPKLLKLIERLGQGHWKLPCAWVVTLKLPYKTKGSLERNLNKALQHIPHQLQAIANFSFSESSSISIRFKVVHLIANSESERTIIALFDRQ